MKTKNRLPSLNALPPAAHYGTATLVFLSMMLAFVVWPLGVQYRNPPFHRFNGLDLDSWIAGTLIYLMMLSTLFHCYRKHLVSRLLVVCALLANMGGLFFMVANLITMILVSPTI